jgi:hypothetical protein
MPRLSLGLGAQNISKVGGVAAPTTLPLSTANIDVQFSTRPDTPRVPFVRQGGTPPSGWFGGGFYEQDYAFYLSGCSITFSSGVWTFDYASSVPSGEEQVNYIRYQASVTASSTSVPITGWTVNLSETFDVPNGAGAPTISEYTNTTIPLSQTSIVIKGLWNPDTGYGPRTQTLTGSNGVWQNGTTSISHDGSNWTLYSDDDGETGVSWAYHASSVSTSSLPRFGWSNFRGQGYLRIT